MRVITLSWEGLERDAERIASWYSATRKSRHGSTLVIGVASGGCFIGKCVSDHLRGIGFATYYMDVACRRPSTKKKNKFRYLKNIIRAMPYFVTNWLRYIELKLMTLKKQNANSEMRIIKMEDHQQLARLLGMANNVIIVDDAIDTGASMQVVFNFIRDQFEGDIEIAVLTVTSTAPCISPDYSVYKKTILRCPWALDYKG